MEKNTKELLLKSGHEIFLQKGYHGTGLSDILKHANVPKGSFYHYFENKEAFLIEVLTHYEHKIESVITPFLEDRSAPSLKRFRSYITTMIECSEDSSCHGGCLVGNMAQELSDSSEDVREKIQICFKKWLSGLEQFFIQAQEEEILSQQYNTGELADLFVDGWQGALLRMKVEKNTDSLHRFLNSFLRLLSP